MDYEPQKVLGEGQVFDTVVKALFGKATSLMTVPGFKTQVQSCSQLPTMAYMRGNRYWLKYIYVRDLD